MGCPLDGEHIPLDWKGNKTALGFIRDPKCEATCMLHYFEVSMKLRDEGHAFLPQTNVNDGKFVPASHPHPSLTWGNAKNKLLCLFYIHDELCFPFLFTELCHYNFGIPQFCPRTHFGPNSSVL